MSEGDGTGGTGGSENEGAGGTGGSENEGAGALAVQRMRALGALAVQRTGWDGDDDTGGTSGDHGEGDDKCVEGMTSSCGALGFVGSCAAATATCENGEWVDCPEPDDADRCEPNNDDNCNGTPNENCECVSIADCDDGHDCTQDTCSEGVCKNEVSASQCLIDDTWCVPSGYAAEHDTCLTCSPTTDRMGWTETPNCECGGTTRRSSRSPAGGACVPASTSVGVSDGVRDGTARETSRAYSHPN